MSDEAVWYRVTNYVHFGLNWSTFLIIIFKLSLIMKEDNVKDAIVDI